MPRDVSLSDSKCWNDGHEWVKQFQDSSSKCYNFTTSRNQVSLISCNGRKFFFDIWHIDILYSFFFVKGFFFEGLKTLSFYLTGYLSALYPIVFCEGHVIQFF